MLGVRVPSGVPVQKPPKALCFKDFRRFFLSDEKLLTVKNNQSKSVWRWKRWWNFLALNHVGVVSRQLIRHSVLVLNPGFGKAGVELQSGGVVFL